MELRAHYYSHKEVTDAVETVLGEPITFRRCAHSPEQMLRIRQVINEMIETALSR